MEKLKWELCSGKAQQQCQRCVKPVSRNEVLHKEYYLIGIVGAKVE